MKWSALFILLIFSTNVCALSFFGDIQVISNDLDWVHAQKFEVVGFNIVRADEIRENNFNFVLGGHNSPGGSGILSSKLLDERQKRSLMVEGVQKMFQKNNTFVFAGNSLEDTGDAIQNNAESVKKIIMNTVFEGVKIQMAESIFVEPKKNLMSYSFPVNVSNTGDYGLRDLKVSAISDGEEVEVSKNIIDLIPHSSQKVFISFKPKKIADGTMITVNVEGINSSLTVNVTEQKKVDVCNLCKVTF